MTIDPDRQLGGVPDDANEAFFDALVRHQIGLLRLSGRVRNRVLAILDETERDISEQIRRRLAAGRSTSRQEALIKTITAIRSDAWKKAAVVWREEMLEIVKAEPEFLEEAVRTTSPAILNIVLPPVALLRTIVTQRPFEGQVLRDWSSGIRRADLRRMESQIRIGITQGESAAAIARRIVGTVRQRGRNGVTEITRRQAAGITRTAVNAMANQAKREFYKANSDLFEEELYVATLDARTTPICRSLDGETFPVGKGPIPPLHFNCRSLRVAALDGEAIGERPARAFTQRRLLDEYNRANGTSARTRDALPRGHKGPFDQFARQRMRELTGRVPAKVTYQEWLGRQSREFQDDVLGPTRARLFRRGDLTLDKFVNRQGDELSLSELATREKAAFRAAGLDPEDFT